MLVGYLTCETAVAMETLSDAALCDHALALLRGMFSAEAVDSAALLEWHVSRWASDEHACGSYSYLPVGSSPLDRVLLSRREGAIAFAGEATSHGGGLLGEGGYPATVHGAFLSGARAAREIAELLGLGARRPTGSPRRRQPRRWKSKPRGSDASSLPSC